MAVDYNVLARYADMRGTPAEIVASLPPVTPNPINLATLRVWLRDNDLLIGGISGTLVKNVLNSESAPSGLVKGVAKLIDLLYQESPPLPTDDATRSVEIHDMINGLLALGLITETHKTEFYSMGGGLRFANVTESDVSDAIALHNLQADITNASAQASSSLNTSQTAEEREAAWLQAWRDVVT